MEKDFVPYELAVKLKELGFDEPCFAKYYQQDSNTPFIQIGEAEIEEAENGGDDITFECNAPLFQQAFRFFREKYGFYVIINPSINNDFTCVIWTSKRQYHIGVFPSPEEAELACLEKLIEIIQGGNNE